VTFVFSTFQSYLNTEDRTTKALSARSTSAKTDANGIRTHARTNHIRTLGLRSWQDKTEGEIFLQRLRTSSAGSNSPPSGLSRIWASPARYLRHYFFHFWYLVQTLEYGPTVRCPWSSSEPPSLLLGSSTTSRSRRSL